MEIFVEKYMVPEVGIRLQLLSSTIQRTAAVGAGQKETGKSAAQLRGHVAKTQLVAGAGGELDLEVVAEIVVELLERLDQKVVDRESDGTAPV